MKNKQLNIRLSDRELMIIKKGASYYNIDISKFILSVMVPLSLKLEQRFIDGITGNNTNKKGGA